MSRRADSRYDDDGRTIVDMSAVDDVLSGSAGFSGRRRPRTTDYSEGESEDGTDVKPQPKMSRHELRQFTWQAVLAGLAVALVFVVGAGLFILFLLIIWGQI